VITFLTMKKRRYLLLILLSLLAFASLFFVPGLQHRLAWRVDAALTSGRALLNPVGLLPTAESTADPGGLFNIPLPEEAASLQPAAKAAASDPEAPPLAARVSLKAPAYEVEDWNNCGPATLSMAMRYHGWVGDQSDIARVVKPRAEDRNVNLEELVAYIQGSDSGLLVVARPGGDLNTLRQLLSVGVPVVVEGQLIVEQSFWQDDDRWAGHYLLITGYDDEKAQFTIQDSYLGPDQKVSYDQFDHDWQTFNRLYMVVYPSAGENDVHFAMGPAWDETAARRTALEKAQAEAEADPQDAFAWFNLGTNLIWFEQYDQAAAAYDRARAIGLPQRMLRYQFGPFFADFHSGRLDDLAALVKYALKVTPNAEEALLWQGWERFARGDSQAAANSFRAAMSAHPGYGEAVKALKYIGR
jgi:uncharacterized protein YvpB